ncbi:MAG: methylmalonyl-CoA mutase N-terminal domain/subunit [Planctomycetota bacterium]|jgi:methylmalonyl-CoA mutase N-terminal domain/subunit
MVPHGSPIRILGGPELEPVEPLDPTAAMSPNNSDSPNTREDWLKGTYEGARSRFGERQEPFQTPSDIELDPIYGEAPDGGWPGEYPFTRGVQPTMYRGRFWTMRQYAGFSSARASNERYHMLLKGGQTGLSVAFDLPTQLGYDSDDPLAIYEVGKVGVPVNSLADVELLFKDIPLGEVSTSMTINATASFLLCAYVALAKRQGVDPERLRGTVQNDILKEYAARGNYRFGVPSSMRLVTDLVTFCKEQVPLWNTISISGYHIREAGSTAVQELAFTLANGRAYVKAIVAAGLDVDEFAGRLSFFFNAHNHLFEEVGKFRAARRMWARIMREEFGAKNPKSWMLRFHTQTAGSMLTSQQSENNVVRVTVQALAAIMGGTQSLHTNSRDEALGLPTEKSAQLALRTQQLLAHESGVADVIDPLGGSPYVESMTDRLEAEALALMAQIDERGGSVPAIEQGFMQREIHRSAMQWQRDVESGERTIVGVNKFQVEEGRPEIFRPDPAAKAEVLGDLERVRAERNNEQVEGALRALGEAARGTENVMGPMLHAVESYATVGEVCSVLEQTFGKFNAPEVL